MRAAPPSLHIRNFKRTCSHPAPPEAWKAYVMPGRSTKPVWPRSSWAVKPQVRMHLLEPGDAVAVLQVGDQVGAGGERRGPVSAPVVQQDDGTGTCRVVDPLGD